MTNTANIRKNQITRQGRRIILGGTTLTIMVCASLYFLDGGAEANISTGETQSSFQAADAQSAWQEIRHSTDVTKLNDFLREFPQSDFAGFAENRLRELAPVQAAYVDDTDTQETSDTQTSAAPDEELIRSLQDELTRIGCKPGRTDGIWGYAGKNALRDFNDFAGTSFDPETPTQETLDAVKGKTYQVCKDEVTPVAEAKADTNPLPEETQATTPQPQTQKVLTPKRKLKKKKRVRRASIRKTRSFKQRKKRRVFRKRFRKKRLPGC